MTRRMTIWAKAGWLAALAGLTLGSLPGRAVAQAPARDSVGGMLSNLELLYGASRYAQETRDAPASVTIITAREIREYGYRTLADVLGGVRGFSTRNDLNYEFAIVRGLEPQGDFNTRVLILVNGQRLNAAVTDVTNVGNDGLVDLDRIHGEPLEIAQR